MTSVGRTANQAVDLSSTRVAFLTDVPTPYLIPLLQELSSRTDLTCLFSCRTSTRGMAWQFDGSLSFTHRFVGGLVLRRPDGNGIDACISARLLWFLWRSRPAAVISAGFSFPTIYALIYAWFSGARLLIFSDGTSFSERHQTWSQRLARRVLVPRAHALIAKSELAARRFGELGGGDKVFIGHHTSDLKPMLAVGARRAGSSPRGPLRLISVGRLIPRKGLALLLAALKQLQNNPRDIHLTMVGSGPEEHALRSQAARLGLNNVTFAGFVQHAQLPGYYENADVFVMPTLQDPFGIALLEAAACGLALISSVCAGATHEIVRHGVTGYAVDATREALAAAIASLARSPALVESMGRAAHAEAALRTPSRSVDGYMTALQFSFESRGRLAEGLAVQS